MTGLEIYSEGKLIERWVLQNGKAVPEILQNGKPLYKRLDEVTPDQGNEYLTRLMEVVDNATFLDYKTF